MEPLARGELLIRQRFEFIMERRGRDAGRLELAKEPLLIPRCGQPRQFGIEVLATEQTVGGGREASVGGELRRSQRRTERGASLFRNDNIERVPLVVTVALARRSKRD